METYPITIGGVTRHVPLIEPLPGRRIPLVEFLGDPELVRAAAEALKPLVPKDTEVLFTTETSPIPLTHVLAGRWASPTWWPGGGAAPTWRTPSSRRWRP